MGWMSLGVCLFCRLACDNVLCVSVVWEGDDVTCCLAFSLYWTVLLIDSYVCLRLELEGCSGNHIHELDDGHVSWFSLPFLDFFDSCQQTGDCSIQQHSEWWRDRLLIVPFWWPKRIRCQDFAGAWVVTSNLGGADLPTLTSFRKTYDVWGFITILRLLEFVDSP